jgi:hypothetical protein
MKSSSLRLEAIATGTLVVLAALAGCRGGSPSPAPVAAVMPRAAAVIVYDEAGDVALGADSGSPVVYTVVMADGTTWKSRTPAQLEALWE